MTQPQLQQEPLQSFHPTESDFGDMRARVADRLKVDVERHPVKFAHFTTMDEAPYKVISGGVAISYPFTRDDFEKNVENLLDDFAGYFNKLGRFDAYPITLGPRVANELMGVIDFRGPAYPFDLRLVVMFDNSYNMGTDDEPALVPVVKIYLTTLVCKLC